MGQEINVNRLPYSSLVFILGIVSCFGMFCMGIVGLIAGIIALIFYKIDKTRYEKEPDKYNYASYKMLNSGRIMAIIGLILSLFFVFVILIALVAENEKVIMGFPWNLLR